MLIDSNTTERSHSHNRLQCVLLATGALSHIVDPGSKLRLQHSLAVIYILPAEGGLEKEMAAHSGILAWRIPGTGEPGGLPSMGSHRVRHD